MHTGPTGGPSLGVGGISSNQAKSLKRWAFWGAILSSMLVSSISLSLLLRLNTGAPQFFLISLNSIRNRHSVPSLDKLPLSLTC